MDNAAHENQLTASANKQRGAALLIVLLLVATLSFVALSVTEITSLSAARSFNERSRSESLWRAFGAEVLAGAAIQAARQAAPDKMSLDDPWVAEPLVVPMDEGGARIFFSDATTCFNVNSLAAQNPSGQSAGQTGSPRQVFVLLVRNIGFREFEGERLADIIIDWLDTDNNRQPQGAEDNHYTALPVPYRSGGQPLANVSELRALSGMTREIYIQLKPFLCAQGSTMPSPVNINMLITEHAPLLAALLGEQVSVSQAADIIAARPPGGYDAVADFVTALPSAELAAETGVEGRFSVISQYVRARAEIVYDNTVLEMTSDFELADNAEPKLRRRRIGADE